MNKTPIEWVKNPDGTQGYTWNPITGCLNGCEYCYARKLANGRLKSRYLANPYIPRYEDEPFDVLDDHEGARKIKALNDPFYPRFWEDRLYKPKHAKGNKGIFVCDMSDLFGIGVPEMWTRNVMLTMELSPQHRFYLLTKQPQNLIKFSPFPDNCWVGVTATDEIAFSSAFWGLRNIEARVKFISFEPLLGSISEALNSVAFLCASFIEAGINQVIIGAQTKPYKPPKIEWVQEIVQACDKAGIPVFLKDNLKPLFEEEEPLSPLYWGNVHNDERGHERADDELRQEMPSV